MKLSILKAFIIISLSGLLSLETTAWTRHVEPPVMGWSSWNTYRVNINEELIRKQADAMISMGLKDAGYRYINIDDGFFGHQDKDGILHTHPERFPNGIKVLSDYIHSKELKAGIYSEAGQQLDLDEKERYTEITAAIREVCRKKYL